MKIDEYVEFLIEHKLTQSQLLLLQLVHFGRKDLVDKYKKAFPAEDNSMIGKYLTDDLLDKGFLRVTPTGAFKLSDKFAEIFVDKQMAFEELFSYYPLLLPLNGNKVIPPKLDRKAIIEIYYSDIQGSISEHRKIMKDLHFGCHRGLINMSIEKFIKTQYWRTLRALRLAELENETYSLIENEEFFEKVDKIIEE